MYEEVVNSILELVSRSWNPGPSMKMLSTEGMERNKINRTGESGIQDIQDGCWHATLRIINVTHFEYLSPYQFVSLLGTKALKFCTLRV